jgi:hypothetical protein
MNLKCLPRVEQHISKDTVYCFCMYTLQYIFSIVLNIRT